jgi:hypothetical protein
MIEYAIRYPQNVALVLLCPSGMGDHRNASYPSSGGVRHLTTCGRLVVARLLQYGRSMQ